MRRVVWLVVLAACGGDGGPTGLPPTQAPTIPNIVGSYSGTWTNSGFVPSTGEQIRLICPGTATVANQGADGSFTGTWTQGASTDCLAVSGTMAGNVQVGGALTVSQFTSANPQSLEDRTGGQCTQTQPVQALSGTANGSIFEMSQTVLAQCLGIPVNFTFTLSTTKSGRVVLPGNPTARAGWRADALHVIPTF